MVKEIKFLLAEDLEMMKSEIEDYITHIVINRNFKTIEDDVKVAKFIYSLIEFALEDEEIGEFSLECIIDFMQQEIWFPFERMDFSEVLRLSNWNYDLANLIVRVCCFELPARNKLLAYNLLALEVLEAVEEGVYKFEQDK